MSHIFISYKRDDMDAEDGALQRLVARLRRNFKVWLDKTSITAGTNWQDAISGAVKDSSAMVFIMSPVSVTSEWCLAEINAARAANCPIIPYIYQKADFPLGMSSTNAIFHNSAQSIERLEDALRELAPETYIHGDPLLITEGLLNTAKLTFAQAAERVKGVRRFFVKVDDGEIDLLGLPLLPTAFCTTYIVGRSDDTLAYHSLIQLALQFSGPYESADFPVRIARHFLNDDPNFTLRMLLVRGPAQITYDDRRQSNSLSYVIDPPTKDENQWADALNAANEALKLLHEDRENPALQLFVQGPVAGITYELGAIHRGLLYRTTHYQYDRERQRYYKVLGSID